MTKIFWSSWYWIWYYYYFQTFMAQILAYTENFLPNCRSFSRQSTRGLSQCPNISMWGTKSPACNITTLWDGYTPQYNMKRFTYAMANSNIYSTFLLGATAHLTINAIIKITGKMTSLVGQSNGPSQKRNRRLLKNLSIHSWNQSILRNLIPLGISYFCNKEIWQMASLNRP